VVTVGRGAWLVPLIALAALTWGGPSAADGQALTPRTRAAVTVSVRRFVLAVAQDVTAHGPTAWRRHFSDTPSFFMAVNGQLQLADSAAASRAIAALPGMIQRIELTWGEDLRIDPLTAHYAVVASSYSEVQVNPQGQAHTERGYFTAVAERHGGEWTFRDAHWSSAPQAKE
jgi:hypothetical protein